MSDVILSKVCKSMLFCIEGSMLENDHYRFNCIFHAIFHNQVKCRNKRVGPDLVPNCLTLMVFLKECFKNLKKLADDKNACKITQHAKSFFELGPKQFAYLMVFLKRYF